MKGICELDPRERIARRTARIADCVGEPAPQGAIARPFSMRLEAGAAIEQNAATYCPARYARVHNESKARKPIPAAMMAWLFSPSAVRGQRTPREHDLVARIERSEMRDGLSVRPV